WNDVAAVGIGIEHATGRHGEWRMREAQTIDQFHDAGGAEQRILAPRHRRRAGVALEAGQRDLEPALPLPVCDDADIDVLVFENRPLLDVKFEKAVDRPLPDWFGALEPDPLQFLAELQTFR